MLEKVIFLLKAKDVFYDSRINEFVSKKDPFVAPEYYVDKQEIINNYEKFLKELIKYYTNIKKL